MASTLEFVGMLYQGKQRQINTKVPQLWSRYTQNDRESTTKQNDFLLTCSSVGLNYIRNLLV